MLECKLPQRSGPVALTKFAEYIAFSKLNAFAEKIAVVQKVAEIGTAENSRRIAKTTKAQIDKNRYPSNRYP
jgi:hypothetical protein